MVIVIAIVIVILLKTSGVPWNAFPWRMMKPGIIKYNFDWVK